MIQPAEGRLASYSNGELVRVIKRFLSKVDTSGGCWVWKGTRDKSGYGRTGVGKGLPPMMAHRMSYELFGGSIPRGMLVCHHCDNPPCVRPSHLFLGRHRDNFRDAYQKGRLHLGRGGQWNTAKTHCPLGHEYDEANTKVYKGVRHCIRCYQLRQQKILLPRKLKERESIWRSKP